MDTTRIPSSFALHSEDCSKENYMSNGDVDRTPHNIKHDQSNCESNLCQPLATIPKRSAYEATHSSLSTPKTSKRRLDFSNANSPDSRKSNAVIISNVDRESHRPHNAREQSLESHNFWLNHEAIEKRVKLLKNLTKNGELLMNQPPELYIEADCDGNERTILAVCSDDRKRWMKIKRNQHVSKLDETTIKPFGLTRRYRCIPDIRGQVGFFSLVTYSFSLLSSTILRFLLFNNVEEHVEYSLGNGRSWIHFPSLGCAYEKNGSHKIFLQAK